MVRVGVVIAVAVGLNMPAGARLERNRLGAGNCAPTGRLCTRRFPPIGMSAQADPANGPDAPSRKELIAVAVCPFLEL